MKCARKNLDQFIEDMDNEGGWKENERQKFQALRKKTFSDSEFVGSKFNQGKYNKENRENSPQPCRAKLSNVKSLIPRRTVAVKREPDLDEILPKQKRLRNSVERNSEVSPSSSLFSIEDFDEEYDESKNLTMNVTEQKPWSAFSFYKANLMHWFPTSHITNEDIRLNFEEEIKKPGAFEKWNAKAIMKNRTSI